MRYTQSVHNPKEREKWEEGRKEGRETEDEAGTSLTTAREYGKWRGRRGKETTRQ